MKTVAVIPTLNEEKHIAGVVRSTQLYVDTVLVTDGGSKDKTTVMAHGTGAKIHSKQAKGLGENLRKGLNIALNGKERPDIIILLDGDGQHNPHEIPSLLKPLVDGKADVCMGNRTILRGMPPYRIFGNGILTAFANFRSKKQFADSMVGFWAIRADAIPRLSEPGWGVYIELLMKVRSNGHRLVSVPIHPIYHADYEENSTLPPFKLGIRLLWFILKWRFICEVLKRGSHKAK